MAIEGNIEHLRPWGIETQRLDPESIRYFESVMMQGNGYIGTRGSLEEIPNPEGMPIPLTMVAGVFDTPVEEGFMCRLVPAPNWVLLRFFDGTDWFTMDSGELLERIRRIRFEDGVLERTIRWKSDSGRITKLVFRRIVSMARPHVCALSLTITPENYSGTVRVASEINYEAKAHEVVSQIELILKTVEDGVINVSVRTKELGHIIAEAARTRVFQGDMGLSAGRTETTFGEELDFPVFASVDYTVEKVVSIYDSLRWEEPLALANAEVRGLPRYSELEREHSQIWAGYWRDSDIVIDGDDFAQSIARFFVFELLQSASKVNVDLDLDVSIGAKCLSGPGYAGHVFWDTELYMLPFYSLEYPKIAEQLLRYRMNRILQARVNAEDEGGKGAKFPWESAATGIEVTPKWVGHMRCWTGEREIHVTADVAFAAWRHYLATGDEDFLKTMGFPIILETARYWAFRAKDNGSGEYVINEVIPPNEYHECVNNSFFTNSLARWNINKALELIGQMESDTALADLGITNKELAHWKDVAEHIRIPYDEKMEMFAEADGFFDLEDVLHKEWSYEGCGEKQMVKQADVLLALYLLPELTDFESFRRHFNYYEPRTDHTSSLSPGVHVLFSRMSGNREKMYDYFQKAGCVDGGQRRDATEGGLHAAALGGGWQSLVFGFGGVSIMSGNLQIDPDLPDHWKRLKFGIRYHGARLEIEVVEKSVSVTMDSSAPCPLRIEVRGHEAILKPGDTFAISG